MAKRKTTTKKTTKKAAKRAAPARKKTASKKTPARKKTATKKAGVKKKAAAKKTASKKKVAKKPAPKKKTTPASKKAPAKKKPASKKTPAKKSSSKTTKKTTKKAGAPAKPASKKKPRKSAEDAQLKAARAAASRLAALAGLPSVQTNTLAEPEAEKKQRRLTKSPLSPSALTQFRDLLLQKRKEVAGDVSAIEGEALNPSRAGSLSSLPQHMADQGSDEFEQTLSLGIAASQRRLLVEIEAALDRIENGVYGICEMTGRAIQRARLEATPWCRYSLEGARMADRGLTPS